VNPAVVVSQIEMGRTIPNLRKSLIKMLWHYNLQEQTISTAQKIQVNDIFDTHSEVVTSQRRVCVSSHLLSYPSLLTVSEDKGKTEKRKYFRD